MTVLYIVLSCLAGGIGRRVCGGAFQQWTTLNIGDYPVRIFFGCTLALAAALGGADMYQWLSLPISGWLGCSIGMFESITLGNGPGDDREKFWPEFLGLTMHGVLSMIITVTPIVLLALHWHIGSLWQVVPFMAAGLMSAPSYYLGWHTTGHRGLLWIPARFGLSSGTEFGELYWGMFCGLGAYTAGTM